MTKEEFDSLLSKITPSVQDCKDASNNPILRIQKGSLVDEFTCGWMWMLGEMRERFNKMSDDNLVHVMPTSDVKEHEQSVNCWCKPRIDKDVSTVIIHNVFAEMYGDERDLQ